MEWLSLSEIAGLVGVAEPVAKKYAAMFKDFLPCREHNGVCTYPRQTVAIFQRIAFADEGEDLESIENLALARPEYEPQTTDMVEASAPPEVIVAPAPMEAEDTRDLADVLGQLMESLAHCLTVMADQKATIEFQQQDIERLKSGFVVLARNLKKLAARAGSNQAPAPVEEIERLVRQSLAGHEALAQELLDRDQEVEERAARLERSQNEVLDEAKRLDLGQQELNAKLDVLEAELVRLRKDRREMEKYLTDKIRRLKSEG